MNETLKSTPKSSVKFCGEYKQSANRFSESTSSSHLRTWKANLSSCFSAIRQFANTMFFTQQVTGQPPDHASLYSYTLVWSELTELYGWHLHPLKLPLEAKGQQLFYSCSNCTWLIHSFLQLALLLVRVVLLVLVFFYWKHCELFPYALGESQQGRNNI